MGSSSPSKYFGGKIALQRNYATRDANADALWSMARSFLNARKSVMLALALRVVALLTSLQEMPSNVYKMQENARRPPPRPDPKPRTPMGELTALPQTSSWWGRSIADTKVLHPALGLSGLGPLGPPPNFQTPSSKILVLFLVPPMFYNR